VQKLIDVTKETLEIALRHIKPEKRWSEIARLMQYNVEKNGFSVVREFVGHGIGTQLHEEPQIPNYGKRGSGPKLKAGMTLAIEPMINIGTSDVRLLDDGWTVRTADGMPSAHFEHTVLITKDEPEILTWRAKTQLK
jgi:methionyl aminopeptidase